MVEFTESGTARVVSDSFVTDCHSFIGYLEFEESPSSIHPSNIVQNQIGYHVDQMSFAIWGGRIVCIEHNDVSKEQKRKEGPAVSRVYQLSLDVGLNTK